MCRGHRLAHASFNPGRIDVETVMGLSRRSRDLESRADILALLEQAEELGLLARISRSSEHREMHPLLRDLAQRLRDRYGDDEIRLFIAVPPKPWCRLSRSLRLSSLLERRRIREGHEPP